MVTRTTKAACPICKRSALRAADATKGVPVTYDCDGCGAQFHATIFHDFRNRVHWWAGKHCNPEFWAPLGNADEFEGMKEMNKKLESGVREYLGIYKIEKIPIA